MTLVEAFERSLNKVVKIRIMCFFEKTSACFHMSFVVTCWKVWFM